MTQTLPGTAPDEDLDLTAGIPDATWMTVRRRDGSVADFDAGFVDGAVKGVAAGTEGVSRLIKPMQSGLLRTYAAGFAVGAVLLAVFVITRMSF